MSGICAIFQFIYHHQHKWNQMEKDNAKAEAPEAASEEEEEEDGEARGAWRGECQVLY